MATRLLAAIVLVTACVVPSRADVIEYNTSFDPVGSTLDPAIVSAGWFFTLPTDGTITSVLTRFADVGATGDRILQLSILDGDPTLSYLMPLASETFISSAALSGVTFAAPPLLSAGEYFIALSDPIGFTGPPGSGTGGVGVNYVDHDTPGAVSLGNPLFTLTTDGTPFLQTDPSGDTAFPIFQINFTPAAVPEPSSMILLGLCGVVGGGISWRRRRQQAKV